MLIKSVNRRKMREGGVNLARIISLGSMLKSLSAGRAWRAVVVTSLCVGLTATCATVASAARRENANRKSQSAHLVWWFWGTGAGPRQSLSTCPVT